MARVLVVEDDDQVRTLAEAILQEAGYETRSASGVEGAKSLIDGDETFEIVFIDIQLGAETEGGLLVARFAREANDSVLVVYTTGMGITDGLQASFVPGARFLAKPYKPDQLVEALAAALGG